MYPYVRYSAMDTILVVEYDDGARAALRATLEGAGYRVLDARCGRQAQSAARGEQVALVVVDLAAPAMSGRVVVESLRRAGHRAVPVFLTRHSDATLAAQGVLERDTALLKRPFSEDALVAAVRAALAAAR